MAVEPQLREAYQDTFAQFRPAYSDGSDYVPPEEPAAPETIGPVNVFSSPIIGYTNLQFY